MAVGGEGENAIAICGSYEPTLRLWDFSRPTQYRNLGTKLAAARAALERTPRDAAALATYGEWYAFRGYPDWSAALLEEARKGGADVSALALARAYWQLDRPAEAEREFKRAVAQAVAAGRGGEDEARYLGLCLDATHSAAASPATRPQDH